MSMSSTDSVSPSSPFLIQISASPIPSLQDCYDFVCDDTCGAVASFVGTTRNNFQNKTVVQLTYEAYVPMARKEAYKLCVETQQQFPGVHKIAVVHVLGDCPVGSPSVILAASSPHRQQALQAVDYLINQLKARIPIWKLEVYAGDERAVWKENVEWKQGKATRVMVREAR
jgi:molybdopterin synthase catalytic subunit